jgi:uncharacterized protein (DUF433 family)
MLVKIGTLFSVLLLGVASLLSPISSATAQEPEPQPPAPERPLVQRLRAQRPHGDPRLRTGLVLATVSATGLRPAQVLENLAEGLSIAQIAAEAGTSDDQVLAVFDETAGYLLERAVETERLPAALAEARLEYYQRAARLMVAQPGLKPAYPGLHELHQTLIAAAVRSAGLDPRETRQELRDCRSLEEILEEQGHSGREAVQAAMQFLDRGLDRLVASQRLTEDQRNEWSASLRESLQMMLAVPGLHLAGKTCAS